MEDLICDIEKWAFMIEDPFDKTYNPSKQLELNTDLFNEYLRAFKEMMTKMIKEQ